MLSSCFDAEALFTEITKLRKYEGDIEEMFYYDESNYTYKGRRVFYHGVRNIDSVLFDSNEEIIYVDVTGGHGRIILDSKNKTFPASEDNGGTAASQQYPIKNAKLKIDPVKRRYETGENSLIGYFSLDIFNCHEGADNGGDRMPDSLEYLSKGSDSTVYKSGNRVFKVYDYLGLAKVKEYRTITIKVKTVLEQMSTLDRVSL